MSDFKDKIYLWLIKKSKNSTSGRVRTSGLIQSICKDIINDPVEIRKSLDSLRIDGKVDYNATANGEPVSSFLTVNAPEVEFKKHELIWMEALAKSNLSQSEQIALKPLFSVMEGMSIESMLCIIDGLIKLRTEQDNVFGNPIFNVSAAYLIGSSKLLSLFSNRAIKAFGIHIDRFIDRPPYIIVGGNGDNPEAVILVENPISFETAIQSKASLRCAFVCTFGFGLSNQGNDFGNQLAGAIELGSSKLLYRNDGKWKDFKTLLSHDNLHFWGDLDMAGIQIFERIATKVPHISISELYKPMINALETHDKRHAYIECVGKSGQKYFRASRPDSISLLNICKKWAVDQEIVKVEQIEEFAGKKLLINPT